MKIAIYAWLNTLLIKGDFDDYKGIAKTYSYTLVEL